MKEKKILEALTDIDDEFIEEAEPEKKTKSKTTYIKWIAVAACFVILTCIAIPLGKTLTEAPVLGEETTTQLNAEENEEEKTNEIIVEENEEEYSFEEEGNTEIVIEGPNQAIDENFWKNLDINQQYNTVQCKSARYYNHNTPVAKSETGEKITTAQAQGTDPFDNKSYIKEVSVYKLKNFSDKIAVAVKFEESDKYFIYVNHFCEFETLGEIVDELKLHDNMKISAGYYREEDIALIKYENIDTSVVFKMLFDDTSLESLDEPKEILLSDFLLEIEISPFSPSVRHTVSVTRKGYLLVNVFHTQQIFFIGKEKTENFIDYVMKNYTDKKLVYTTDSPVVYNETAERIPVTEVFSNGYKP